MAVDLNAGHAGISANDGDAEMDPVSTVSKADEHLMLRKTMRNVMGAPGFFLGKNLSLSEFSIVEPCLCRLWVQAQHRRLPIANECI